MIAQIKGKVIEAIPLKAIIDIQGIGYEVLVPLTTSEKIPSIGGEVKLYTRVIYREDSQTMYGFATKAEKEIFDLIVEKVSGVGPKIALNLLSCLSVSSLQNAIVSGDVKMLSKCPGIGKRTAERMIVELKDKLGGAGLGSVSSGMISDISSTSTQSSAFSDAVAAMVALGYSPADADKAIRKVQSSLGSDATTEELIRTAFSQK
jgi:Holliday junction DNA helicase RuvA